MSDRLIAETLIVFSYPPGIGSKQTAPGSGGGPNSEIAT